MPPTRRDWLAAAVLAGAAFAVFAPALGCRFVNYDDPDYVTDNPHVLEGLSAAGTRWAFTTFSASNWHPLTWLSLQLDATLWKGPDARPDPRGFHLTNVLLHAANAALLFLALRALTGAFWRSLAVALLFAVHPLRVESVAWVTERKDVLSALLGFLALWAYAGYSRAPSLRRYLAVLAPFGLSLLAKPMLVTLPCLLLVLDGWPLRRARAAGDWWQLAAEKLPLFVLVVASGAVTVRAQAESVGGTELFPPHVRLENAALSYVAYLAKTVWPAGLAVYYPHPVFPEGMSEGLPPVKVAAAVLLLGAVTAAAVALRRRAPYLLAGWLWYLGTLVPVIGLVQVGGQAYADRYTYFPQVGLLLAVCWGAAAVMPRSLPRAAPAVAAAAAVVLAALTRDLIPVWHDSVALWEHTIGVTGRSPLALVNLGVGQEERRLDEEAARSYEEAIRLSPEFYLAHDGLGNLRFRQGRLDEAARELEEACQLAPGVAVLHTNLGNVLCRQGKWDEAARQHERAIELAPDLSVARSNLGQVELERGNPDAAAARYREALRLWPGSAKAHAGLGHVLTQQGRLEEAVAHLREAVRRDPEFGRAHFLLGVALEQRGDAAGAARHFELATRFSPELAVAWFNLGMARDRQGRPADAAACLAKAVERQPSSPLFRGALASALNDLAADRAREGRYAEAAAIARQARDQAAAAGRPDLVRQIDDRLRGYEGGRAGRSP